MTKNTGSLIQDFPSNGAAFSTGRARYWGLRQRMIITITGAIFVILALLIFIQVRQSSNYARKEAYSKAEEIAYRYSGQVSVQLNDAMLAARTEGQNFEGLKIAFMDDRTLYNSMLRRVLAANTNFLAIWTCWEPDALDSKDSEFKGKPNHDGTGRFIPVLWHDKENLQLGKLVGYEKPGEGDYYLLARSSGKETIVEPQVRQVGSAEVYVATVAVPIRLAGDVVGVVGIDVPMAKLQAIVEGIHPYQTGYARIISGQGVTVAHPNTKLIGTGIDKAGSERAAFADVQAGRAHVQTVHDASLDTDVYEIFVPIRVGESTTPWSLAVSLPIDKILAEANNMMLRSIGFSALGLLLMSAIVIWLARSITRPIQNLGTNLTDAAGMVEQTSHRMVSSSQSLAEGASEQAASLEETSSSLEEMASMTKRNSENSQKANELAKQARTAADKGVGDMQSMSSAMEAIKISSDDIAKIIKTIDEIAFQTNILALNAAVEAARAGEAGMGFAVVADEVRNLAQRSAQAAKETAGKIEGAIAKTAQGVDISSKVSLTLNEIVTKVRQVDELVAEVAGASREQTQGITQINTAVGQMDKVTQSNAANAEESAAAAEELNAQATTMKESVSELLRLVGGNGHASVTRTDATPSRARETRIAASMAKKRSAPVHGNGNGHAHPESAMAGAANGRNEIPLEDDFKNF